MTAGRPRLTATPRLRHLRSYSIAALTAVVASAAIACGSDGATSPPPNVVVSSIVIDGGPQVLERGTVLKLSATVRDTSNTVISIPVAWRSLPESIVSVDKDGVLTARDTGLAVLGASALGVEAQPVQIHVVWIGAAKVAGFHFTAPNAVTPGAVFGDSLRILVTNLGGGPVPDALVRFVASNGGTVSSSVVKTGPTGLAATQWTFGSEPGTNDVTATVVKADSATLIPWVEANPVKFTVTTFAALTVVSGDNQTGQILSPVAVAPTVKLIDVSGSPRAGVPVTFVATANGKVAHIVASTDASGVASPGAWTLGDASGEQQLIITVENARLVMHAIGTGTPTHFVAADVSTSSGATCARAADQLVSCMGTQQLTGRNDVSPRSTPGRTTGDVHFKNVAGSDTHFCGVSADSGIYCWGPNALADTNDITTPSAVPSRLASNVLWQQVTPGEQHNCALASDQSAYCWGIGSAGQLGDNTTVASRAAPRQVSGGFTFSSLAAGNAHECGLSPVDSKIYCWGLNSAGQLGNGTTDNKQTPTAVVSADKFTAVAAGGSWTCALDATGRAQCWGGGTGRAAPQPYAGLPAFKSISVGAAHACAVTNDGVAYCWGDNSGGQLGDGTQTVRQEPVAVATTMRFSSISAGTVHTCGVTLDGSLACWGTNQAGEVGYDAPSATRQLTPRFVVIGVQP